LKALILAAGKGERLLPLTRNTPKPMIQLAGKPILQYIIENIRDCGIRDIIIVVSYKNEQIITYFENGYDFGVRIKYVLQEKVGMAENAILCAEKELENEEEILIAHSDFLSDREMIARTINNYHNLNAEGVIAVTLVDQPSLYGIVSMNEDAQIEHIIEKPKPGSEPSKYAVAGVYVFRQSIFEALKKNKTLDLAIQDLINSNRPVYGSIWEKEWVKVRYPWDILTANEYVLHTMLSGKGSFISETAEISPNARIEGPVFIDNGATVRSGSVISGPVYIGPNSYIGTNSLVRNHTSISENVIIGFGVEVKNSVILDNTFIGRLSYIGDSVVGRKVEVGAGTQTWNINPLRKPIKMRINGEVITVPREKMGAIIGDKAVIGINVSIYPGAKIGCKSIISAGAIVQQDIPDNVTLTVKQQVQYSENTPVKRKESST